MKNQNYSWLIWVLLYGVLIFLTLNKHSKSGYFNYHSEIWADKAGYYVYLPAAFKYNFEANQFPDSIDVNTGNGFVLDFKSNTVQTKYTYGVSLMQLPFYGLAEMATYFMDVPNDGFSPINHLSVNFSAITYFLLGLILLFHILRDTFNKRTAIWTLLFIFLGTNLYYYVISATGMSHVYSFFLFSAILFLLKKSEFLKKSNPLNLILFGLLSGLIVLIRPSNIVYLFIVFFVFAKNLGDVFYRIKTIIKPAVLLLILLGALIIIAPQFVYWKYAFGSWIKYSYQNEGFNWGAPQMLSVWFSPNNGLFLYGSVYGLIVLSIIYSSLKNSLYWIYLALFFAVSYITASWWAWEFGCSYGSRNFVEYLAIFSIPFGVLINNLSTSKKATKIGFFVIGFLLIALNLKLIYTFDDCYFGEGDWDWNYYLYLITEQT